jgi:hypothetical protein
MGDALASITSFSESGAFARKSSIEDMISLAWKVVAVQAAMLATAITLCHVRNDFMWGWVCGTCSLYF